jgi:hypothetical protein
MQIPMSPAIISLCREWRFRGKSIDPADHVPSFVAAIKHACDPGKPPHMTALVTRAAADVETNGSAMISIPKSRGYLVPPAEEVGSERTIIQCCRLPIQ